jgi:hypothetical protein
MNWLRFGGGDVVHPPKTLRCMPDVLALGTVRAMTALADLVVHLAGAKYFAPSATLVERHREAGGEVLQAAYMARRTDVRRAEFDFAGALTRALLVDPGCGGKDACALDVGGALGLLAPPAKFCEAESRVQIFPKHEALMFPPCSATSPGASPMSPCAVHAGGLPVITESYRSLFS